MMEARRGVPRRLGRHRQLAPRRGRGGRRVRVRVRSRGRSRDGGRGELEDEFEDEAEEEAEGFVNPIRRVYRDAELMAHLAKQAAR